MALKRRGHYVRKRRDRGYRVLQAQWVDPYPEIMGTKPEKMVLAELIARQVPFYFQYPMGDVKQTPEVEDYRLDFYIPALKMSIEVNGDYWHTLGDAPKKDAYRYAVLEFIGIKTVVWWESDILTNLRGLFEREPLLNDCPVKGPPLNLVNTHDDLKAVRKMNASRRGHMSVTAARSQRRPRRRRRR